MAVFRSITQKIILNNLKLKSCSAPCYKFLNYSAIEYGEDPTPSSLFFNKEVQSLLKKLSRIDLSKVYRKRKLGESKLEDPVYKFMTDEELQQILDDFKKKADELLQIPPVVPVRKPINNVISRDPALQGLDTSKFVFTDITYALKNSERLVVIREPDGSLREAEWEERDRINQVYFPISGKQIEAPKLFDDKYLEDLLQRSEFEFILDAACLQFEPDDPHFQKVTSITYQYINNQNEFNKLRSTRHFGGLVFFLVWHKNIDNLLLELVETLNVEEANDLLKLYSVIHNIQFQSGDRFATVTDFIQKCSNKKADLELALQSCKEVIKQKEELDRGISVAHGTG